jgi:hypothetical protein
MTYLLLLESEIISHVLPSVSQTLVLHCNTEAQGQNPAEVAHEPLWVCWDSHRRLVEDLAEDQHGRVVAQGIT